MKGIFLLAIGSLGAAGAALGTASVITAAPASADVGCSPKIACDFAVDGPPVFVNGVAAVPQQFTQIVTGQQLAGQLDEFVNAPCDPEEGTCGLVSQPQTFLDSINPVTNLQTFGGSILGGPQAFVADLASQPQTFVDSINDSLGAFGPDDGPETE